DDREPGTPAVQELIQAARRERRDEHRGQEDQLLGEAKTIEDRQNSHELEELAAGAERQHGRERDGDRERARPPIAGDDAERRERDDEQPEVDRLAERLAPEPRRPL